MSSTRFAIFYDNLRGSYWFLPAAMAFVAAVVAISLYQLDLAIPNDILYDKWFVLHQTTDQARGSLSLIATSALGVIGVVFSMTLVALTMASSQFGSFLLRAFLRDTGTQTVLGTYSATVVYSICLLLILPYNASNEMVPQISITFALILLLLDLAMLLYYFNHVAISVQASKVVAVVAKELGEIIENELKATPAAPFEDSEMIRSRNKSIRLEGRAVSATHSGYIRAFDYDGLTRVANRHGLVFLITRMTGDFVAGGETLLLAWPGDEAVIDSIAGQVNSMCLTGETRTMLQDPLFGIGQLVVVASRALSPGINDPVTAVMCIDRLGEALGKIVARGERAVHRYDARKELRVIAQSYTFDQLAGAAFNMIRQYGRGSAEVLLRMLASIRYIAPLCRTDAQRQVLLLHAGLIEADSRAGLQAEYDRERVRHSFEETVRSISLPVTP